MNGKVAKALRRLSMRNGVISRPFYKHLKERHKGVDLHTSALRYVRRVEREQNNV